MRPDLDDVPAGLPGVARAVTLNGGRPCVLFVGWRKEAARAARRMGLDILLLEPPGDSGRARPSVSRCVEIEFLAPRTAIIDAVTTLASDRRVVAVVALTEGAVPPAATARMALGLPGMDESTAAGCRDKWLMRERIREAGIPCADVVLMDANTRAEDLILRLGLPLVLKQRAASGGRGTVLVREAEWVPFCLRPGWLAESFVDGVEMSLESWVHGGEILFANPTEYLVPGVANVVPADLRRDTLDAILRLNARALRALGVTRGMTHMELFLTDEGPVFGEIAARPPGGRIMQLVERVHGWDPWEAVIRLEAGESVAPPGPARCVAGVWFLHPGPGRVRAIHGLQEVHDMPGLDVTLRVGPGDTVTPRLGTGQSVGCLEVEGPTHADVSRHLRAAAAALHIELED